VTATQFLSDSETASWRFGRFVVAVAVAVNVDVDIEAANGRRENFEFPDIVLQNSIAISC
jgi:hypothetical protein